MQDRIIKGKYGDLKERLGLDLDNIGFMESYVRTSLIERVDRYARLMIAETGKRSGLKKWPRKKYERSLRQRYEQVRGVTLAAGVTALVITMVCSTAYLFKASAEEHAQCEALVQQHPEFRQEGSVIGPGIAISKTRMNCYQYQLEHEK